VDDRDLITVAIPSHPGRDRSGAFLARAIGSVTQQELPAWAISVANDTRGEGAAATRQRALDAVATPWVAFLDSDDQFLPRHLLLLSRWGRRHDADFVFSHYRVEGGTDPRPWALGKLFDPDAPHETTSTVLVRTELARKAGIMRDGMDAASLRDGRLHAGEDWEFTKACVAAGAVIVHLPRVTWIWNHHGANTSGIPGHGDAA
jgi:glycosyltransferase involved in cell wall biosynthesis